MKKLEDAKFSLAFKIKISKADSVDNTEFYNTVFISGIKTYFCME